MKIIYTADYLYPEIIGGGELNDYELCIQLERLLPNSTIEKIKCSEINMEFLQKNKDSKFIISNFTTLSKNMMSEIISNFEYIIYEHDHKYLPHRNPGLYKDFLAPKTDIINFEFYKNAKMIFCQSSFHKDITYKNLGLNNIHNNSGNLWSRSHFLLMEKFGKAKKKDVYSIMGSRTYHKNTMETIRYCEAKKYDYEVIESNQPEYFLQKLAKNKKFIFLPNTPETLSRVVVEARMMGVETITNKNIGASYEPWIRYKGAHLINVMKSRLEEIPLKVWEALNE